jgi:peptide/nickel transport system substrate-binding protein
VGKCFTKAGDYGRDIIATGPYMVRGEDKIDTSSCGSIKPEEGFDPTKELTIVRNPSYDPSTDSPTDRENNIDGVDIKIDTNTSDIFDKIAAGSLDGSWASIPPPEVLQNYLTDPNLKPNLHSDPGDRTWYITMNFLTPPFDDIHVRKAVNLVTDKAALLTAIGGPTYGQIATHIMPPTVLDFKGENYDPYATPNEAGDLNAAKQEMSKSKYDKNHDGSCSESPECQNVLFVNRNSDPFPKYGPIVTANLASIGIHLKERELDTGTAYTTIQTVKNLVPIAINAGWGKDYADPSTFAVLFDSSGISCEGQVNYSEVGMTASQAKECGANVEAAYNALSSPPISVDSEIAKCGPLTGSARQDCWIAFDKDLMENVVPWVPYRWGNAITVVGSTVSKYVFDQFSGAISWCNISVNNNVNPETI